MREELHAFDHVHPNEKGHEIIANTTCVELPENWGCTCPEGYAKRSSKFWGSILDVDPGPAWP